MNTQELFDASVNGIIEQNALSVSENKIVGLRCFYRHPESGLKCAVGQLIKDENYHRNFDDTEAATAGGGTGIGDRVDIQRGVEKSIGRELKDDEIELLDLLQQTHDESGSVADFVLLAKELAKDFKLNVDNIKEVA